MPPIITAIYTTYIFNFMSIFKQITKISISLLFILPTGSCSTAVKSSGYSIFTVNNQESLQCGDWLYQNLSKRVKDEKIVYNEKEDKRLKKIMIEVNDEMPSDYAVEDTNEQLKLSAKTKETMQWLIFQFIKQLSYNDKRISADDLPPVIIHWNTHSANFDFAYREPHFLPNLQEGYSSIIGTNMVEKDWGIWGHHLGQALSAGSNAVYAKRNGQIIRSQFCFSNEETFLMIKDYILENYGDGTKNPQRFMIMPNDNDIVCDCNLCKAKGNTNDNATPAVAALLQRLAGEFPRHLFFTSAYITTKLPPNTSEKWMKNTGVMVSTIDLPKGIVLAMNSKAVREFSERVAGWKKCTPNIYIWDYASNFDDYLTPLPVLEGLKSQLAFFKSIGITGVFLNASGYDYSTFDDMKTFVSAALLMNNNLSVEKLCTDYFRAFYPVSAGELSAYYLSLEEKMKKRFASYNLYGSFQESLSYLDEDGFVLFYEHVSDLIKIAKGDEKKKLEKLYTALSYTRLQVAYDRRIDKYGFAVGRGDSLFVRPEIKTFCQQLAQYDQYDHLLNYSETDGCIQFYLNQWTEIMNNSPYVELLMNKPLRVLSPTDSNPRILNDGVPGFTDNYHQGWFLSYTDLVVEFNAGDARNARTLTMRFLVNKRHHFHAPAKTEIYKDGVLYKEISTVEDHLEDRSPVSIVQADVDFSNAEVIKIKVYRNASDPRSTLACDEVRIN